MNGTPARAGAQSRGTHMTTTTSHPVQSTVAAPTRAGVRLADLRLGRAWEEWLLARVHQPSLATVCEHVIAHGAWHELSRCLAKAERTGLRRRAVVALLPARATARTATQRAAFKPAALRTSTVHLDELRIPRAWRGWLATRIRHDGGLAATLRAFVFEIALVELLTVDYDAEAQLRKALHGAGRTWRDIERASRAWRRGERMPGLALGAPLAARMLQPELFTRVPQLRVSRRERTRG